MRVLVPEAHTIGSIACIRSLGRAGHQVLAMSSNNNALGFLSRYCHERVLLPPRLDGEPLGQKLLEIVQEQDVDLVLPSEGIVTALGSRIHALGRRLPCGPEPLRLQRYIEKFELFKLFLDHADESLRRNLPPTVALTADTDLFHACQSIGEPLFAKFDARKGKSAQVVRFATTAEALTRLPGLVSSYGRGILQSSVPGRGAGVFFLRWNRTILATLMHRRIHEVPHTGGVSSLRETWWDEELYKDALRRIEAMDWWGVGMLEYRYDGPGRFFLMEFNARFWGSLHLALFAGIDFPRLLVDAWAGATIQPLCAKPGVVCRLTFPKEIEYLLSLLRDPHVSAGSKIYALAESIGLSINPTIHSDLWFPGDRALYWHALLRTPGHFLRRS